MMSPPPFILMYGERTYLTSTGAPAALPGFSSFICGSGAPSPAVPAKQTPHYATEVKPSMRRVLCGEWLCTDGAVFLQPRSRLRVAGAACPGQSRCTVLRCGIHIRAIFHQLGRRFRMTALSRPHQGRPIICIACTSTAAPAFTRRETISVCPSNTAPSNSISAFPIAGGLF